MAVSRGLNLQLGDDRLIGTLFLYRDDNPNTRCVLVTGDLPLTVKAHHYQIEFLALDETLKLPSEPDPLEKKNKRLEAELLRYNRESQYQQFDSKMGKTIPGFGSCLPAVLLTLSQKSSQNWQQRRKNVSPLSLSPDGRPEHRPPPTIHSLK